ncbi:MAG TPA: Ig-like domain-containing protein [Gemmatimonadales bacterium]|jgi:hypothetical protein
MASIKTGAAAARPGWMTRMLKLGAGTLSAGAALVSILSSTSSLKDFVHSPQKVLFHLGAEAHWAGLTPSAVTATSLGDSIHLAVTVTDERGATMTDIAPVWTSSDEAIAAVDQGGTVVARGPGSATIVVSVGKVVARSRITVHQEPTGIRIGDSLLWIPEGERGKPRADVIDASGAPIAGVSVAWRTSDAAIVAVDSLNEAMGMTPGEATLTAVHGELQAALRVQVQAVPASVTVTGGEDQRALAGRPLATPVTAQVVSRSGRPVSGVPVEFRIQDGEGSCVPAVDTSDARGTVRTVWTLGDAPGRQHLAISTEGVSVVPVLTSEADPLASRTRIALVSENLAGPVGDTLSEQVVVRVTDSTGAALPDVHTTWGTPDGGIVAALGSRTDSLGEARARWKLGPKSGRQRVQVQVGNPRSMPMFTARATALPGAAATIAVRSGDAQVGAVGSPLPKVVVVQAIDRLGNPASDARIVLAPKSGSVPDSALRTDSTGQAKVRWTLGKTAGQQRMVVKLEGAKAGLDLTARARSGEAAKLDLLSVQSGLASGKSAPKQVTVAVAVTDEFGNSVAERTVRFTSTTGTVSPAKAVSDAKGQAKVRYTPTGKPGKRSIVAEVPGTGAKATFTLP